MIIAITGDVGGGKTHYAVNNIVAKQWRAGRDIYSNTLLFFRSRILRENTNIIDHSQNFKFFERLFWSIKKRVYPFLNRNLKLDAAVYDPQDFKFWRRNQRLIRAALNDWLITPYSRGRIIYFSDVSEIVNAENALIFIDEGSALFDSRNWEMLPDNFSNSLRQSRKNGLDLLTTTQDLGQIDKNYRRLVQRWLDCRMTWLHIWSNPVIIGLFAGNLKDVSKYVDGVSDVEVPVKDTLHYWITIFRRRRYDTNYNVGFSQMKIVCLDNLRKTGLETIWAIVPKKMTYKEIVIDIKAFQMSGRKQKE